AMVAELRNAGVRAEMFLGNTKNFGKQAAAEITDNAEWKAARPGQFEIKRENLVAAIQQLLADQQQ
ncbi:MAG TPA: hypothetical protein VLZ53_02670, partial [Devosia sp.]|nr:hypothetical protein [Devosia sp.]